jgi:hypothetical protein
MAEPLSAGLRIALSVLWTSRARRSARIESHAAEILALFKAHPASASYRAWSGASSIAAASAQS